MLVCLLVPAASASDDDPEFFDNYTRITSREKLLCTKESPCRINQGKVQFDIIFYTSLNEDKRVIIDRVEIINLATKKSEVYEIPISELGNRLIRIFSRKSPASFYAIDLLDRGVKDLVLLGAERMDFGRYFYYFLYNPKTQKFVMSDDAYPVIKRRGKKKILTDGVNTYTVDKDFVLRQKEK